MPGLGLGGPAVHAGFQGRWAGSRMELVRPAFWATPSARTSGGSFGAAREGVKEWCAAAARSWAGQAGRS